MSRKDFATFVDRLKSGDTTLRDALLERFGTTGEEIPVQQLIAFATERGFAFNVVDADDELSESQLDGVTGGVTTSFTSYEPVRLTLNASTSSFSLTSTNQTIPWDRYLPGDQF